MNVVIAAFCLVAIYTDLRWRRIPNWLTGCLLCGVGAKSMWLGGLPGLLGPAASLAIMLAGLLPVYLIGALGAGDVKLMAALTAFWSWPEAVGVVLNMAVAGFFLALLLAAIRGQLLAQLRRIVLPIMIFGLPGLRLGFDSESQGIPYGVAIGVGGMASMLWNPVRLLS